MFIYHKKFFHKLLRASQYTCFQTTKKKLKAVVEMSVVAEEIFQNVVKVENNFHEEGKHQSWNPKEKEKIVATTNSNNPCACKLVSLFNQGEARHVFTPPDQCGRNESANKKRYEIYKAVKDHIFSYHLQISHYRRKHAPYRLPTEVIMMYQDFEEKYPGEI